MPIDRSKYPPDWFSRIRPEILVRDKFKCKYCGIPDGAFGYRASGGKFIQVPKIVSLVTNEDKGRFFFIRLSIAHIDQNVENNDFSNLAALCQQCHNRLDAPHRTLNRKMKKSGKS